MNMNSIRKIREEKGISMTELSKLSGVPYRTIQNWEDGSRTPRDVYQLMKIAEALGVRVEDLIKKTSL